MKGNLSYSRGDIKMKPKFPLSIFEPYLSDDLITDINFNGDDLWVDHLEKGRMVHYDFLPLEEVMQACVRFSNIVNSHFNLKEPLLEADYGDLRVSMIHPSVSNKLSVSIRKTPAVMRLSREKILREDYMPEVQLNYLASKVKNKSNIMVSGLPGAGKTELIKYLTTFIDDKDRVITIEDSRELHYDALHPKRDSVSIKVTEEFSYSNAIKASMRQRPNWLLVSEIRGTEVEDLLKSISTGTHLLSTVHARCAQDIPLRMLYMMEGIDKSSQSFLGQLYDAIDVGVHVEMQLHDNRVVRYVREIVEFDNQNATTIYRRKVE